MTTKPQWQSSDSSVLGRLPRIEVDESEDSPFHCILRHGGFAADDWMMGPNGPYKNPGMPMAEQSRGLLREALLHLCELGFIDIDMGRIREIEWVPGKGDAR